MGEESPGPPEEAPEDVAPPAPAPYGTEAYFAQQKAAKGIAVPDEEGKEGFFEIFGLSGARDKPPPPPATKIEDAFPNVLSADERKVLIEAMKANKMTNFGAAF